MFICALWSPAGKGLSFVVLVCEFVTFPIGILDQVWYLIVSIPSHCTITYFYNFLKFPIGNHRLPEKKPDFKLL